MKYKKLGKTNLTVSICGFGCYRVNQSINQHRSALEFALTNGINLVDTSANYTDGGSEVLVGQVLEDVIKTGEFKLEDFVVVTKGGYIQGENLRIASEREREGRPFKAVVKCSPDLWHCIHPEFLSHQITLSLGRLKIKKADIYLLHNPEYFLTYSSISSDEERQKEYYHRIKKAFVHLEKEVKRGRISYYGISSNTFGEVSSKSSFTSLEKIIQIARGISTNNHFAVIQLPFNLIERGALENKNQVNNSKSVLELASEENLGVLINRPLNAIVDNKLTRLADFAIRENRSFEEINELIKDLNEQENFLQKEFVDKTDFTSSEKKSLYDCLSLASILSQKYEKFESPNHFQEIKGYYLIPRANYAISQLVGKLTNNEELINVIKRYAVTTNILLDSIESDLSLKHNETNRRLHEETAKYLDEEQKKLSLSQKAILMINSLSEVSCTLVGMRKIEYVKDVLGSIRTEYVKNPFK
ncbi:MAG: aldo/keto reductase [Ignavibacteriaceae bacterium]